MKPVSTILIANASEYFSPIEDQLPLPHRDQWVQTDYDERDFFLFWEGDNKLVIVPKPMDPQFIADVLALLDYRNCVVLWPSQSYGELSRDILADSALLEFLANHISCSEMPSLIAWGSTEAFQDLVAHLRAIGLRFEAPELPARDKMWTVSFFGSKAGFRQLLTTLAEKHSCLSLPAGWICRNLDEAYGLACQLSLSGRNIILKPNHGCAGWATTVVSASQSFSLGDSSAIRLRRLIEELIALSNGDLIIIETFVESPKEAPWLMVPTVDAVIDRNGETRIQFIGNMRMDNLVNYNGVEFGEEVLPKETQSKLAEIALVVGRGLGQYGYRGWFDVDFVIDARWQPYCTEINTRRTGPVYAFGIYSRLQQLYGPAVVAAAARDVWNVPGFAGLSYISVKEQLSEVLFPIRGEPRGLVIAKSSPLLEGRGTVGYVAVGKNREDVLSIESHAAELVG